MNQVDLSRADLNLLVLFEVVYAEGNVGRAARKLSLTSSAVSHGLRRLREWFDDPLFLRTPKGVVPTVRARELAPTVADILERVRAVVAGVEQFDPARSTRHFRVGAPDALSAVIVPEIVRQLAQTAPLVTLIVRHLLPQDALAALEGNDVDVAIAPIPDLPARFAGTDLQEEDFVVVARADHPFLSRPSIAKYCAAQHVLVSTTGGVRGFVDEFLEKRGLSRRVALSVPHFMHALAALDGTDLIAAVPRGLAVAHAARFGLAYTDAPSPVPESRMLAITTRAALADPGVAWLLDAVERASRTARAPGRAERASRRSTGTARSKLRPKRS